jgi:hypothetical protein
MTVPYYFNTRSQADWLVEESTLDESYRDVCNVNPRERKTWEATLTVKHHGYGKRAVIMASYWPGKPVTVQYLWAHVLSDVPTLGVNEHLYTRVAAAGRYNPTSARDLAYRGSVESPKREDYREDTHGLFAYGVYMDAVQVWRASLADAREHNRQHQPIRDAISGVLNALEKRVRAGAVHASG